MSADEPHRDQVAEALNCYSPRAGVAACPPEEPAGRLEDPSAAHAIVEIIQELTRRDE